MAFPIIGMTQTCQDNILSNPDFEAQHISGWDGAGMYSESGSDRYISVCTNGTNARQTKSAIGGENYTLTVKARKSFSDSRGVIRLKFLSSSWQPILEEFAGVTATSFQTLTVTATAPANAAWVEVSLIKDGGSGCVDADDWCLTTSGGGGTNLPDLRLGNLTNLTNAADPGDVVQFNFNLINSGAVAVSGNYSIGAYLSTDSNLGSRDVRVGEVNTGNTAVGTISNVAGAISIPNNTATGTYSLILKADDGEVITESNENNNLLLGSIAIGDTGGGNGPTVTVSTPNTTVTGPFTVSIAFSENVTGFTLAEIQVTNGTKSNPAQQSAANYSFTVTPSSAGNITIAVLANSASNNSGEGNQVSNTLVVNFGTDPGGDECGFDMTYNVGTTSDNQVEVRAVETNGGFTIMNHYGESLTTALPGLINYAIDKDGNQTNISSQDLQLGHLSIDGTSLYEVVSAGGLNHEVSRYNFDGSSISQIAFTLVPPNTTSTFMITSRSVLQANDGYVVFVVFTNTSNGNQTPSIIKLNNAGSVVYQNLLAAVPNSTLARVKLIGQDGGIYVRYFLPGRVSEIRKYSAAGSFIWAAARIGDLVSNRMFDPVESNDGAFIYVPFYEDPAPSLGKYNAVTGAEIYRVNLSSVLSPSVNSFFGRNTSALPTADGGVVVGYTYIDPSTNDSGYEYGKLNTAGNKIWRQTLPDGYALKPVLEVNDGGYLFFGKNGGVATIVRTTSDGSLTPDCDGGGGGGEDGIDLELNAIVSNNNPAQWSFFSSTFVVTNNGTDGATGVKITIPTPNGIVLKGGDEYTASQGSFSVISNEWNVGTVAAGGNATLTINYFSKTSSATTIFGQVTAQNGTDADSSPNNNSGNTPNEDDEAAVTINASSAAPRQGSIEELSINQLRDFQILNTYPTVSNNEITIAINSKKEAQLLMKVYNMKGQEVSQQQINITTGANEINVNISELSSGMHHVMLLPENGRPLTTRFIKQRL